MYSLVIYFVGSLLRILQFMFFARAIMSWFVQGSDSKIYEFLCLVTEPVIQPFRSLLSRVSALRNCPFDFAFMLAFFVAEEFAAQQKENAAMKAKMKVLVDKIEEYRGVEEGMHRTLLTAQSIAQETIDKAKKEAEEISASAKDETANKVKDTQAEINTEEQKLETARKNTAEFIAHVAKLYQTQARALSVLAKGEKLAPVQQT